MARPPVAVDVLIRLTQIPGAEGSAVPHPTFQAHESCMLAPMGGADVLQRQHLDALGHVHRV